jgi:uncharacterized protein DUF1697
VTGYVALLRGVNLAAKSTLRMADLKAIAADLELGNARTYVASGNLLFTSDKPEGELRRLLEKELRARMRKDVRVMVRTAKEMEAVVGANPFADTPAKSFFSTKGRRPTCSRQPATRRTTSGLHPGGARSLSLTGKGVSAGRACAFRLSKPGLRAT